MATPDSHGGTFAGTAGGTFLTVLATVNSDDVAKTVILACIGAITSFFISLLMKWLMRKARHSR